MVENKAIVISLDDENSEIIELASSLGYNVKKTFIQKRQQPNVKSYIGSGKVKEINEYLENNKSISLVIINGNLKPSQWFLLEKKFGLEVFDRVRLILAIFEERADRKEAKLQVKLAQLEYERPFVRELIHRARSGEHPGFMAGGEYQVDDYYEMIKKQMKKIKENLKNFREKRQLRRQYRHKSGFYLVSLTGYTNAGKSSLLNLLSDEKVKVEGRLFSTLSTTTRKIKNKNIPILLTDTVGFIQNLPAYIIDAFHSTLEEIEVADIVLLIVDISEEINVILNKLKVSINELIEIGVASEVIIVFNKIDTISNDELKTKKSIFKDNNLIKNKKNVFISVKKQKNLNNLLDIIHKSLPRLMNFKIEIPINKETQSLISWIYEKAHVLDIKYDNFVAMNIECDSILHDKILSKIHNFKEK